MVMSLLAGAIVAIGVAMIQLPRVELIRGPIARARMQELASFASWRAIQVGLRPGTLAVMRAVVASTASLTALGELETARLLVAPVLTVVNGAGVYLLPTYADQVKRRLAFRPAVGRAMVIVGCLAAAYGLIALWFRDLLLDVLTDGSTSVTTGAIVSWVTFSLAFGLGIPAGSAMVALGHSRRTFTIRAIDAGVGITAAAVFAAVGWVSAVPAGLAVGALRGSRAARAGSRRRRRDARRCPACRRGPRRQRGARRGAASRLRAGALALVHAGHEQLSRSASTTASRRPDVSATSRAEHPPPRRTVVDWRRELLWIVPLVLIVATEFKIRRRNIDDALSGTIDLMIALELCVYAVVGVWALWRLAPSKPRLEPLTIIMWGYVLSTAVSSLYSPYPTLAFARAVQLVIIATVIQLPGRTGRILVDRPIPARVGCPAERVDRRRAAVRRADDPSAGRAASPGCRCTASAPARCSHCRCRCCSGCGSPRAAERCHGPRWVYGSLFAVHLVFLLLTRTRGSIGGALARDRRDGVAGIRPAR